MRQLWASGTYQDQQEVLAPLRSLKISRSPLFTPYPMSHGPISGPDGKATRRATFDLHYSLPQTLVDPVHGIFKS